MGLIKAYSFKILFNFYTKNIINNGGHTYLLERQEVRSVHGGSAKEAVELDYDLSREEASFSAIQAASTLLHVAAGCWGQLLMG
jgi:hypothetical protein